MAEYKIITNDNIREEVHGAIASWATSDKKPPYSIEQLVAMALLTAPQGLSGTNIFKWICNRFQYYREVVVGECYAAAMYHEKLLRGSEAMLLQRDVQATLLTYELSISKTVTSPRPGRAAVTYNIDLSCGLPLIRGSPGDAHAVSQKNASFFSLPSELRNTIYDMVFGYPKNSGLVIKSSSSYTHRHDRLSFSVAKQGFEEPFGLCSEDLSKMTNTQVYEMTYTRRPRHILAPLLTCRQFYNEAMPTFFRVNKFHTDGLEELQSFLKRLPLRQHKHLREITTTYWASDVSIAPKTFRLLREAENLSTFNLRIDEQNWMREKNARSTYQVKSALELPGIATLRSLRGLQEVNLEGGTDEVTKAIKEDLMKPKSPGSVKKFKTGLLAEAQKRKMVKGEETRVHEKERLKKASAWS